MKYFYIINVWNRDGYSFMICSDKELSRDEVLDVCKENHLFYENKDANDAYVDAFPLTEDIVKYKPIFV
jgi:hypothetical protein